MTLGESRARPSAKPLKLRCRSREGIDNDRGFAARDGDGGPIVSDRLGVGKGRIELGTVLLSVVVICGCISKARTWRPLSKANEPGSACSVRLPPVHLEADHVVFSPGRVGSGRIATLTCLSDTALLESEFPCCE